MKDMEFLFPYQGKICPIANESCPYKLYCTDCDLYNSLGSLLTLMGLNVAGRGRKEGFRSSKRGRVYGELLIMYEGRLPE